MPLKIGIENGMEGRSIVWVLDHMGCFSYGSQPESALEALPAAIQEYNQWLVSHGKESWCIPPNQEPLLDGTWDVFHIDENYRVSESGYEVNAWFQDDWRPLSKAEIDRGSELLGLTRQDLLGGVSGLDEKALNNKPSADSWSIDQVLNHVRNAEWWYLDRLGMAYPRNDMPLEIFESLKKIREHMLDILTNLAESNLVLGIDGEFWSPRKLLRRTVWHERDHTFHIKELLSS
jgi:hypothetical protein